MPRFIFGGEVVHIGVQEDAGNANAFKRLTAGTAMPWRTTPGGSVTTDFLLWDGSAFTTVATAIVADANGYPPAFQGPDGVAILYDPNGYALVARDAYASSGAVASVNGDVGVVVLDAADVGADPAGSAAAVDADLQTQIDGKAATSHTHAATAISDSSAAGQAVIKAADYAAIRALLSITPNPIRFSAETAVTGTTGTDRAGVARTITEARMRAGVAPTGSSLVAVVQHWNGSAWSTVTTLTMTAGSTTEQVSGVLSQAQSVGDMIRLNVTSVGSTTPAEDVVVDVTVTS